MLFAFILDVVHCFPACFFGELPVPDWFVHFRGCFEEALMGPDFCPHGKGGAVATDFVLSA